VKSTIDGRRFLEAVRESMDGDKRGVSSRHQRIAFAGGEVARQRHEAVVEKRVDGARGSDGELREKLYRLLQIAFALRKHRGHLLESFGRGKGAVAWRVVFLFQEGENAVRAFADVKLRIALLGL
jgi:hypothetical protein